MEPNDSMSHSTRAFYLPATAVRSSVPGRVEQFVTSLFRDHSALVRSPVSDAPSREFYLPAAAVRSPRPGRVERFVTNLFRDHSTPVKSPVTDAPTREFYLPATPRP